MSIRSRLENLEESVKPDSSGQVHAIMAKVMRDPELHAAMGAFADRVVVLCPDWVGDYSGAARKAIETDPEAARLAARMGKLYELNTNTAIVRTKGPSQ